MCCNNRRTFCCCLSVSQFACFCFCSSWVQSSFEWVTRASMFDYAKLKVWSKKKEWEREKEIRREWKKWAHLFSSNQIQLHLEKIAKLNKHSFASWSVKEKLLFQSFIHSIICSQTQILDLIDDWVAINRSQKCRQTRILLLLLLLLILNHWQ